MLSFSASKDRDLPSFFSFHYAGSDKKFLQNEEIRKEWISQNSTHVFHLLQKVKTTSWEAFLVSIGLVFCFGHVLRMRIGRLSLLLGLFFVSFTFCEWELSIGFVLFIFSEWEIAKFYSFYFWFCFTCCDIKMWLCTRHCWLALTLTPHHTTQTKGSFISKIRINLVATSHSNQKARQKVQQQEISLLQRVWHWYVSS